MSDALGLYAKENVVLCLHLQGLMLEVTMGHTGSQSAKICTRSMLTNWFSKARCILAFALMRSWQP